MLINALSPWFGAKRSLSEPLARAIGNPKAFWDVFCGSCAVLFSVPRCAFEVVNDLNADLINLARVVRSETWTTLHDQLERTFVGPDLFNESAAVIEGQECHSVPGGADLERAYHFMVYSWQGRSGTLGTVGRQSFAMRHTSNGGNQARRFRSAVASMPEWADRLANVTILNDNAFTLIPKIEDKRGTVIYADPPYFKKSAKYVHDFAEGRDGHVALAEALARFKLTRVVVSYYDHPRVAELYPGWKIERVEVTKAMAQPGKRDEEGATKAVEVIVTNDVAA